MFFNRIEKKRRTNHPDSKKLPDNYLRKADAACLLGITVERFELLIKSGRVTTYRDLKSQRRFNPEDLKKLEVELYGEDKETPIKVSSPAPVVHKKEAQQFVEYALMPDLRGLTSIINGRLREHPEDFLVEIQRWDKKGDDMLGALLLFNKRGS